MRIFQSSGLRALADIWAEVLTFATVAAAAVVLARVDHFGTYACRSIRGGKMLSQHAFANALDVSAIRLADGRTVSVAGDFDRADPRGRFLRHVTNRACRWFRVVLSPNYNAAHQDHLHLDRARWLKCS